MKIKKYLKLLQEYEISHNSLEELYNFIAIKDSSLDQEYCDGDAHLPSFILLKKLSVKFDHLILKDRELHILFDNAIKFSKIFYSRVIEAIHVTKHKEKEQSFEYKFNNEIYKFGEQLINLLISIKYRIRLVRLHLQSNQDLTIFNVNNLRKTLMPVIYHINQWIYRIYLMNSIGYSRAKSLYYFIGFMVVTGCYINNVSLHSSIPTIISTMNNIFLAMIGYVVFTLLQQIRQFGKIDITGKNIVAYKYKLFFNNMSNKKMYDVFTMRVSE